jgi:hypothetical protein
MIPSFEGLQIVFSRDRDVKILSLTKYKSTGISYRYRDSGGVGLARSDLEQNSPEAFQ